MTLAIIAIVFMFCALRFLFIIVSDIEKYEREHKEKEWSEYVNYMIDEAMKRGLSEQEIKERQRIRRIINELNEP
jgi:DNA-binding transcriptional regulator YhcF (GntR family)